MQQFLSTALDNMFSTQERNQQVAFKKAVWENVKELHALGAKVWDPQQGATDYPLGAAWVTVHEDGVEGTYCLPDGRIFGYYWTQTTRERTEFVELREEDGTRSLKEVDRHYD